MANLLSTWVSGSLTSTGRIITTYNTDRYQFNLSRASGSDWWFTNDSDKLGLHINNVGDKFYFGTGGDFWSSANGWLSTALGGKLSLAGGTMSGSIIFANNSYDGLRNVDANAGFRLDDPWGNIYTYNTAGGYYVDATSYYFRSNVSVNWMTISGGTVEASVGFSAPKFSLTNSTNNGYITGGGDWGIRFSNDNGWIQFGPANNSWAHIYSDKTFYFNQELYVNNVQVVKNSGTWGINITGSANSATTAGSAGVATYARRIAGPERIGFNVGGEASRFYPIAIFTGAGATSEQYSEFIIERGGYEDPGYSGIGFSTFNARFSYKPSGWGYQATYFHLEQLTQTTTMLGDYIDQYQSSQAIIWLRGATRYNIYSVYGGITLLFSNEAGGSYSMAYGTYDPIDSPREKATTNKYYEGSVRYSGSIHTGSNTVIHSGNIASQSVSYASSSGNSETLDNLDSSEFARGRAAYQVLNLDTIKQPGLYQYDGGIGGTQPEGVNQYNLRTIEIGSGGRYSQMAFDWASEQAWFRRQTGDTWSTWREFIHSGNIGSQNVALLQGYSAYSLIENSRGTHSGSDFPNGTLVTTDINASEWAGASFVMEVSGKSYSSQSPFKLIMQGYLYADTIINVSAMSYGSYFPAPVKVMNLNGNLAFWWPRGSYWNSFEVHVRDAGGSGWNRVTGIDNSVDPEEATKKVSCTPIQVLHTNTSTINTTDVNATNFRVSNAVYFGGGNNYLNWTNNRIYSNVGIEAPIFYDANDTGFYLDPNGSSRISYVYTDQVYTYGWFRNYGNQGIYNQDYGTHFYSNGGQTWVVTGSGGSIELQFRSNHQSTLRGYVYADTSNNIGFLNDGGSWSLRMSSSRNAEIFGSDLVIGAGGANATNINMGDGDEGTRIIHCNSNRIGFLNQSASWGSWCYDDGSWATGVAMYSPIYYDSDDTGYYINPNSASQFSSVYANNWFRPQGSTGLYFQSYGRGIWASDSAGASYGNVSIYGDGINSWPGYAINNLAMFMARDIRRGIFIPSADSWLIRYEQSSNMAFVDFELQWGSDIRHKSNIKRLSGSLDKVKQLKGVSYNYKGNERTSIGFIAQEVEPILPEVVSTDADGFKSVGYANIVALLSEAIKEQQAMIEELRAEIDILKSK